MIGPFAGPHALRAGADELAKDVERFKLSEEAARIMPAIGGLAQAQERARQAQESLDATRARLPLPEVAVASGQIKNELSAAQWLSSQPTSGD